MGDIADYWREHKEYVQRRKNATAMGMTLRQYDRWERKQREIDKREKQRQKEARCTIQCECGCKFIDVNGHNSHKQRFGRNGHKATATLQPAHTAEQQPLDDWCVF